MLTLIESLKKVNDPRQKSGKRHPLWLILLLVIFGVMFGYLGYRDLEAFAKSNQKLLVKTFNLTLERVPSYSTIRRAMMLVNTSDLVDVFNQWAGQLSTPLDGSNWVSIDGKCLRSTCLNYGTDSQDFVSIVSLFSQSSGLVLRLQKFENKKSSEIKQVLIKVERSGTRGQKDYKHLAYYISSLSTSAEIFASKIRGHWLIENQLHWVKDVFFQEDSWPLYNYTAVTNFSILKTIALNIYRFLGFSSLTVGQRWLNYKLEKLILLVS